MIDYTATFIFFFAVIDPIGTVPVFIAVTRQMESRAKRRVALTATLASAGILLFFVIAGELILKALEIPLPAFQIAGGIVLFLFALSMIFGESKPEHEIKMLTNETDTALFPLAVPSIAGPGAMLASVLLTETARHSLWEQCQITLTMLSVLLLTYFCMLIATFIHRFVKDAGASLISRVMGLILTAVATSNTLSGIKDYFNL
jgi:multiple antibiotic resistance protein